MAIHSAFRMSIGAGKEDEIWTARCDWGEIPGLLGNPHQWVRSLSYNGKPIGAKIARRKVVQVVIGYPLDVAQDDERTKVSPVIVEGVQIGDVISVRSQHREDPLRRTLDLRQVMPPDYPEPKVVTVARPADGLAYVHFPITAELVPETMHTIATDPRVLVGALANYDSIRVVVPPGAHESGYEEKTPLLDYAIQGTEAGLGGFLVYIQSGCPSGTIACAKAAGTLRRHNGTEYRFTLNLDTAYAICYYPAKRAAQAFRKMVSG